MLLNDTSPNDLLHQLAIEAEAAALMASPFGVLWEPADHKYGYGRVLCRIPISPALFDRFFHGRSGYRAQYHVSPANGHAYNKAAIARLVPALSIVQARQRARRPWTSVEASLQGRWSKLWMAGDLELFEMAPEGLAISRWARAKRRVVNFGLRTPMPEIPMLDVKGTFIDPSTLDEWVSLKKRMRSEEIHNTGIDQA